MKQLVALLSKSSVYGCVPSRAVAAHRPVAETATVGGRIGIAASISASGSPTIQSSEEDLI